jgi:hypothetical protein
MELVIAAIWVIAAVAFAWSVVHFTKTYGDGWQTALTVLLNPAERMSSRTIAKAAPVAPIAVHGADIPNAAVYNWDTFDSTFHNF